MWRREEKVGSIAMCKTTTAILITGLVRLVVAALGRTLVEEVQNVTWAVEEKRQGPENLAACNSSN